MWYYMHIVRLGKVESLRQYLLSSVIHIGPIRSLEIIDNSGLSLG